MKKFFFRGNRKDSGKGLDEMPEGEAKANHVTPTPKEAFDCSLATVAEGRKTFEQNRGQLLERERSASWDAAARESASEEERKANNIVLRIREDERDNLFGNKASEAIPGPDTLDMGGQFLTNLERTEKRSQVFAIAKEMPKGMHLHLHFNAELDTRKLIAKARDLPDNMFIRSTQPLISDQDYADAELVFNVLPANTPLADCFSSEYKPAWKTPDARPWMRWPDLDPEHFVRDKMVLSEEEVYGISQTVNGFVYSNACGSTASDWRLASGRASTKRRAALKAY
jgi:adenosine deaminase CECR1